MNKVLLHTPEGVRDIYGKEYLKKLAVEEKLREKLLSFGYEDIQTPTFEYFDVYSNEIGTTPSKDLYKFFDKEGDTLVLRPDFTPSIARCAAKYFMEESVPLRFCYVGNTFTNTSHLQGKLKEVTQLGAELIGDPSPEADAEMVNLVIESLLYAGLTDFQVSIGQVEYFKGLCEEAGLSKETELRLRECISAKNDYAAADILQAAGVSTAYRNLFMKTIDTYGSIEDLRTAQKLASNARSVQALAHLEKLYEILSLYGTEGYVSFDLGMLSKYNYYTGIIFKGYTYGVGDAIVKGGRYDSLLGRFGKEAAAIGFVIVVDDLLVAMGRQNVIISGIEEPMKLYYTEETFKEKLMEAKHMRSSGKKVELLPKSEK